MMAIITNSYANVCPLFIARNSSAISRKCCVAIPNYLILLVLLPRGSPWSDRGTVVTLVSLFFNELQIHNYAIMLAVMALTHPVFLGRLREWDLRQQLRRYCDYSTSY